MPSFCTRLASICSTRRCSPDMPACARLHQTAIWRIRPCNGIHHQRGRRPTFFQKSRTNDFRQSIGKLALALLVKSFQTLCGDLLWGQERYPPPVVRQYIAAQTPDQPWHFAAYLKQCTFVLGPAMVVASISETMQFCRHVRAFLRTEWGNEERGFVCQMSLSLSVQSEQTPVSLSHQQWWHAHLQLTLLWLCHWLGIGN